MKKILSLFLENIKSLIAKIIQRKYLVIIGALILSLIFSIYYYQKVKLENSWLWDRLHEKLGPHLGYNPKSHNNSCFNIPSGSERPVMINREDEIKATDLVWNEDFKKLPAAARKLILKEVPSGVTNNDIDIAFFDLNNDGTDEVFIHSRSWDGSGGRSFMILENQKKQWKQIAFFTGSFIMINRWVPEGYDRHRVIVYWYRGGGADTDQVVMAYKNHEYKD